MTLTTFLPDAGVYKNTLRRFKWGSFLYFIMLFFCVPFVLIVKKPSVYDSWFKPDKYMILNESYMMFPYVMAFVVPTVVALLIFNYVHSPRQGIFTHSLPVTRAKNYVSGILAGFTLMFLPILANAAILFAMIPFGFSNVLCVKAVFDWIFMNVFVLFVMFSVAVFSSFLTGNSFAQIAINVIIHILPLIASFAIILLSSTFVYGYSSSVTSVSSKIFESTPVVWLSRNFIANWNSKYALKLWATPSLWIYALFALVMYILAYVLYKYRKIENCGEVAAFAIFKPILKYAVTLFMAIAAFGMMFTMDVSAAVVFGVAAVVSAITYFAAEMILNKTLKVFGAYKGFLAFATCFAVFISYFAFSNVFGYETYVPEISEVKEVTMSDRYNGLERLPMVSGEKEAKAVMDFHKGLLKDIPVSNKRNTDNPYSSLNIVYVLKNGKRIEREYHLPYKKADEAENIMFEIPEYKLQYTDIDIINVDNIKNMNLNINSGNFSYDYALNDDVKPFLEAVKKDIEHITYEQYNESCGIYIGVNIHKSSEENKKEKIFKDNDESRNHYYNFSVNLNKHYKNTFDFLKEKGYYDLIRNNVSENMFIVTKSIIRDEINYIYGDKKDRYMDMRIFESDLIAVDAEDAKNIFDMCLVNEYSELAMGENFLVYCGNHHYDGYYASAYMYSFPKEKMPEFLRKYVVID